MILLLEASAAELDLYGQMLFGFGGKLVHRCLTAAEARTVLANEPVDLVITAAKLGSDEEDGYAFVRALRRCGDANAFLPVIMLTGHTPSHQVAFARDSGVHFVVRKPVSANVLLERILWIAQESRPIVECDTFVGPDRRFQRLGPPNGVGRRHDDLPLEVGETSSPNLGQDEVDQLFSRPRSVA